MLDLREIFEPKDIIWFLLGLIIPPVASGIKDKINKGRTIRAIRKKDEHFKTGFQSENILPLTHGSPYYKRDNLKIGILDKEFHMSMPRDIYSLILEQKPEFDNVRWECENEFFGERNLEGLFHYLSDFAGILESEAAELVEDCKKSVANMFLDRIREPFFNGPMYGISSISDLRVGRDEESCADIKCYKSDYYTHRVMAKVYQTLLSQRKITAPSSLSELNRYYPFLTSIGMDVLLLIDFGQDLVLAKRSKKLFNMVENRWHLSMNEALSTTDIFNDRISLDQCVTRGLNEELGISPESHKIEEEYGDIYLIKDPIEVGITGFVRIDDISFEELKALYKTAKDSAFEGVGDPDNGLVKIKYSRKAITRFCEENKEDMTPSCRFAIDMLLSRMISDNSFLNR